MRPMDVLFYVLAYVVDPSGGGTIDENSISMVSEGIHTDKEEIQDPPPYEAEKHLRVHAARVDVRQFYVLPAGLGLNQEVGGETRFTVVAAWVHRWNHWKIFGVRKPLCTLRSLTCFCTLCRGGEVWRAFVAAG